MSQAWPVPSRRGQRRTLTFVCLLGAMWVVPAPLVAQGSEPIGTETSLGYEHRHLIKGRLRAFGGIYYDQLYDPDRFFGGRNELNLTSGVSYDLAKRIRIEGGLGLYHTYLPEAHNRYEIRLWQSATLDWPDSLGILRRFVLSHRFRLEERFTRTTDWSVALRLRYRLAYAFPINRFTVEPGAFYIPSKVEFYFPVSEDAEPFLATQARFTTGLGHVINKTWSVELRYAWQQLRSVNTSYQTSDQFIELRVRSAFRIRDLLKSR